ncbi:MAG: hypothetical protein ABI340_06850 [Nitrososphaera sp.]|jgi:hypothetical protein
MSVDEPFIPRPQYLTIDAMKIQLFTNLNLLALEVRLFKMDKRSFGFDFENKKVKEKEITKFIVSVNESLDYLLETAKNVFQNPLDPDGLEYKRFADMANRRVRQSLVKYKYLGLKKANLG